MNMVNLIVPSGSEFVSECCQFLCSYGFICFDCDSISKVALYIVGCCDERDFIPMMIFYELLKILRCQKWDELWKDWYEAQRGTFVWGFGRRVNSRVDVAFFEVAFCVWVRSFHFILIMAMQDAMFYLQIPRSQIYRSVKVCVRQDFDSRRFDCWRLM